MKKHILLFAIVLVFFSCAKKYNVGIWDCYTSPEYDGKLYIRNEKETLYALLCVNIPEIDTDCSIRLSHTCTKNQYQNVKKLLEENGAKYFCLVENPDVSSFPDLTDYLGLVMSSDDMNDLWATLGLEESRRK